MDEGAPGIEVWRNSRLWDLAAGLPLMLLCLFGVAGDVIEVYRQWPVAVGVPGYARIASEISSGLFLALQFVLLCIRRLPLARAPGLAPRIFALIGANSSYVILLLPKVSLQAGAATVSALLICGGGLGSIVVLAWLGRGFSVFPQARSLTTGGLYRLVRHPLYLFEQISLFGVCLQYLQPWSFLIVLAGFGLQFPRMAYEEAILTQVFPGYADYAARTPMIIPGWRHPGTDPR